MSDGSLSIALADTVEYAGVSGDLNPLHYDLAAATAAGFATPVSTGMLHGARVLSRAVDRAAETRWAAPTRVRVRFSAPLPLGVEADCKLIDSDTGITAALCLATTTVCTASLHWDKQSSPDMVPTGEEYEFPIELGWARRFAESARWPFPVAAGTPAPLTFATTTHRWSATADPVSLTGFELARLQHGEFQLWLPEGPLVVGESYTARTGVTAQYEKELRGGPARFSEVTTTLTRAGRSSAIVVDTYIELARTEDRPLPPVAPLAGSRDPLTGQLYYPRRKYSVDGALRPCEDIDLPTEGELYSWTTFAGRAYGQIDLKGGVRLQCELDDGPHQIGTRYRMIGATTAEGWRFARA